MAELRAGLEAAGFVDVATYIQSGNIVLSTQADGSADGVADQVSAVIADRFDLDIAVVVRTADEIATVIEANPFPDAATSEPKYLQVFFSPEPLADDPLADFDAKVHQPDRIEAVGNEIYVAYAEGMSRSKLDNKVIDRHLGLSTTARNWNTVLKLATMAGAG